VKKEKDAYVSEGERRMSAKGKKKVKPTRMKAKEEVYVKVKENDMCESERKWEGEAEGEGRRWGRKKGERGELRRKHVGGSNARRWERCRREGVKSKYEGKGECEKGERAKVFVESEEWAFVVIFGLRCCFSEQQRL
jgi:hypothetical protein